MSADISENRTASIFEVLRGIYPEDRDRMIYLPDYTASKLKKATTRIFIILQVSASRRHTLTSIYCPHLFFFLVVSFTKLSVCYLGNAARQYDNCFILNGSDSRLSKYRLYRVWPGATEKDQVRTVNNPILYWRNWGNPRESLVRIAEHRAWALMNTKHSCVSNE